MLGQLQAIQEQALTERVRVEHVEQGVLNEDTGQIEEQRTTVWEGPAQVVRASAEVVESGGKLVSVTEVQVKFPVHGSEGITLGHVVTVLESIVPGTAGAEITLNDRPLGGWSTLRRFRGQEVRQIRE
ncbi:hypothetical protein FM112_07830 [Gulosibacter sp. 10]|nr:hypothetical protein FM112_07830 [Gulosibacter sp. 10]